MYEQKPNTGSLFKNDRASKTSDPQAKGDAIIDGVPYWVSAWTNIDKKGNRYQSLKFTRKEPKQSQVTQRSSYDREPDDLDSDTIPF